MPKQSIDYLNARRESRAASGGTTYVRIDTATAARRAVDERARARDCDALEEAALEIDHVFADFRAWARNLRPVADVMAGADDDWF